MYVRKQENPKIAKFNSSAIKINKKIEQEKYYR